MSLISHLGCAFSCFIGMQLVPSCASSIDCIYFKMNLEGNIVGSVCFFAKIIVLYTAMDYKIINRYDFKMVSSQINISCPCHY